MTASQRNLKSPTLIFGFAFILPVLAIFVGALPASAQDQSNQGQDTVTGQEADRPSPPDRRVQNPEFASQALPPTIALPAGTVIPVRLTEWLSSDKNQSGDRFSATLEQPLIANGWVVARRGQIVTGRVAVAQRTGHGNSSSQLGLELSELTMVDGQVLPINTELVQNA